MHHVLYLNNGKGPGHRAGKVRGAERAVPEWTVNLVAKGASQPRSRRTDRRLLRGARKPRA
jgi:hypothetical protein